MAYIVVVDDDEDFARAIAKVLADNGHDVRIEFTTESVLENMEHKLPDLMILDVMFPENSSAGFELARAIRHHREDFKNLPVLMLTAVNAQFPLGFSCRDIDDNWLPVSDFMEKPVDFDVLINKVLSLLKDKN